MRCVLFGRPVRPWASGGGAKALLQRGPLVVQQFFQRERTCGWPGERCGAVVLDGLELLLGVGIEQGHVDPLAHGWRKAPCRVLLERDDFPPPVIGRLVVRPAVYLQQVGQHLMQVAPDGVEFGQTDVLDLLDDMLPVQVIHPFPAREAT